MMSFGISYLVLPSIIKIAHRNQIVDMPDLRKAHTHATPLFGGVGIFLGFVFSTVLFVPSLELGGVRYLLAAVGVIFLVGARDDLEPLTPLVKLIGQLISISLLVGCADIRLTSFYGLFGLGTMSPMVSYVVSILVFIFLINAFNLIDGIDALCSSVSIWILAVIGVSFLIMNEQSYAVLAFSAAGATLAFLRFNISPSKIFMGDSGSLVLGTICSVLLIQMIEIDALYQNQIYSGSFIIGLSLMIIPVFDTCRVFFNRISQGKWPLNPDKTHLHHLLLEIGLTHMQSTGVLLSVQIGYLLIGMSLQEMSPTVFFIGAMIGTACLTRAVHIIISLQGNKGLRTDP